MTENNEANPDERHLRILSIFYYLLATGSALTGCIVMSFALLGVAMMAGLIEAVPRELAMFFGLILTLIEAALGLFVWTMCLLEALTARSLGTHSRYRFCFVMACIELLNFPFGTVLGIITIVMLSRPGVLALYEGRAQRDPRLAALDAFDDEGAGARARNPAMPSSESIQEGTPPSQSNP